MKKILTVLFFMMSLVLVSCDKEDIHKKVFDSLEVTYSENESKDGVKSNFTLPVVNEDLGATIEYESKNLEVVTIVNGVATVNRSTEDVNVTILVTVKIKNDVKTFDLVVKVLKKEAVVTEKYTVTYIVDGNVYLEEEYDKDTLLVLAKAPIKANHTFKAWLLNDNLVDPGYKITKNIELVAKFEKDVVANKYTVTYIVDGDVYLEEEYEENALLVLADAPTKENYSFKAWLLNDSLVDPGYKVTKSIELVAKFEEKQPVVKYNVTFVVDSKVYFEKEIAKDAKIEFPNPPTKENYEFKGWLLGKEIIGANYIVTKEIELVAMFEINQSIGTSFTETFDNLKSGSSSYSDGSFIGVNDIEWTYTQSRTDQALNGTALTFGNKSQVSVLSATIEGGISKISMKLANAFSGSSSRAIAISVNGEIVTTFNSDSTTAKEFSFDLNVKGDVLLEISSPDKQRVTIDDIVITANNLTEEQIKLHDDKNKLAIPQTYIENATLVLQDKGFNESVITWTLKNPSEYINLETMEVKVPAEKQVNVTLVATLKLGEHSEIKEFVITLGEGDPVSILVANKLTNGSFVKTKGIVTAIYGELLFLEDFNDAIIIKGSLANVKVNDQIIVKGVKNDGKIEVSNVTILGDGVIHAKYLESADYLESYLNRKVLIWGFLKEINNKEGFIYIDELIKIRAVSNLTLNKLDILGFEANVIKENNEYILLITDVTSIESTTDNKAFVKEIMNILGFSEEELSVNKDLNLENFDSIFNSNITWVSSNTNVIKNDGTYIAPEAKTEVTLTATVTVDGTVIGSFEVFLSVAKEEEYLEYYNGVESKTGNDLLLELRRIISNAKATSYDAAKGVLEKADVKVGTSKLYLIYDSKETNNKWDNAATWNREHVWPQSKLGSAPKGESHNLRASDVKTNSNRGNEPFVELSESFTGNRQYGTRTSGGYFPGDEHKGDVARIVMFMVTRYSNLNFGSAIGNLNTFLKWHQEDPVNEFEINRNNVIHEMQGNRNPFIDHPEFAEKIWGTAKKTFKQDIVVLYEVDLNYNKQEYLQ